MLYNPPLIPMPDIPVPNHFGSFGVQRKHDIHMGIDLYCAENSPVYAIEGGKVVGVVQYTGESVGSPWWNETKAVYIEGDTGVIGYGEIETEIVVGLEVKAGERVGKVKTVLKKDKGKPTTMLHVTLKRHGYAQRLQYGLFERNLDPTLILLQCKMNAMK